MSLLTYAALYHTYKLPVSRFLRVLFVLVMSAFIIVDISLKHTLPKGPIFFLSVFFMAEVIYRFKVLKTTPKVSVNQNNTTDVYKSFTLQAINCLFFAKNMQQVLKNLNNTQSVQFLLRKANISFEELSQKNITREQIAQKAFELVKSLEAEYVTRMDLFAAYILLTEPQTQLLFKKHIKPEEFLYILYWARVDYPEEEHPAKQRVVFWGEGFVDNWTTGWSLETRKYTSDLTYKVLAEKPDLLGRKKEFQAMIDILSRPAHNSVLLLGETGTGKTSLVDALAINSFLGTLPGNIVHKRVYELMIGLLTAGVKETGDLQARLETVLEELNHAGNIILYLPNLENITGAQTFHLDLTGALIPYLRGKHLPIIATMTPGAYKNYVEPTKAFADLFETVRVEEMEREDSIQLLLEKTTEFEQKNHVIITYKAVVKAVDLAKRYMPDRALPGSAVSLLESTASSTKSADLLRPTKLQRSPVPDGTGRSGVVDEDTVVAKIEEKTHVAIAAPGQEEKNLLLHLEETLHERIVDQEDAINAIAEAIRRLRSGMALQDRPISFLFLGPTGVGKTETAKALAQVYFGGENKIIRLDMSEYTGADSIDRLLGSAPGRGNDKGELTEKVRDNPFSLILLDEFEKAHPEILDLFLQVLEDGRLTDNHGKTVSFTDTIIIATSNAGALFIQDSLRQGEAINPMFKQKLLNHIETEHMFKPELLNRFDDIIVFKELTQEHIRQIAELYLKKVQQKLKQHDIVVSFDNSVIVHAAQEGFDPQFGARPLRRFIQDKIEDALAKEMLKGKIDRGSKVGISVDGEGKIQFQITQ